MAHPFLRSVLSTHNRRRLSIGLGALLGLAAFGATASAQGPWRDGMAGPDCNQNEVPDYIEIQLGLVDDDNNDGIPDECQIAPATGGPGERGETDASAWPRGIEDCNGNGVPDPIDVWAGVSVDANLDGIPDECLFERAGGLGLPLGRRAIRVSMDYRLQGPTPAEPLGRILVVEEFAVEGPQGWERLQRQRDATEPELLLLAMNY